MNSYVIAHKLSCSFMLALSLFASAVCDARDGGGGYRGDNSNRAVDANRAVDTDRAVDDNRAVDENRVGGYYNDGVWIATPCTLIQQCDADGTNCNQVCE